MKNKFKVGDYVKVSWTTSILKIRRWDENDENSDFCWFDENCGSYWYHCDAADFDQYSPNYYCNTSESSIIGMATEEEFLKSRKESFEFWLERLKKPIKYYENEIEKINQLLNQNVR